MTGPSQFCCVCCLLTLLLISAGCTSTPPAAQQDAVIWNDDPTVRIDLAAAEARLRQALESGEIESLTVLQIDRNLVSRTSVSSMLLEKHYDFALENRRMDKSRMWRISSQFLQALSQARPVPSDRVADLRWGYVFGKGDGTRVFSAYCDASGKRGIIDGACYTFEAGSLAELADSLFPEWMK